MDEDWIEEEIMVYVDYENFITASEINDPEIQFKIIGLEGKNIISEINGKIFSGTYADPMGTLLFFAKDEERPQSDNVFEGNEIEMYKLEAMASKVIKMKREFVEPKKTEEEAVPEDAGHRYVVDMTYQEALDRLLKPGTLPPRTVTDALDNKIKLKRDLEMEYE